MDSAPALLDPAAQPECPHGRLGRVPVARRRVISASKRTDIPAFYLKWLIGRCREGWVDVPNPLFRRAADPLQRLTHVSLRPDDVAAIVWWSKNYAVYTRLHAAFADYPAQYFHLTITSRRPDLAWLEPEVPPEAAMLQQVEFLARLHGPQALAWRYDPLVFWEEQGELRSSWDAEFFERMARALGAIGVPVVFTSVADRYRKFERRLQRYWPGRRLRDPEPAELAAIVAHMRAVAEQCGLRLAGCAEPMLAACGVAPGRCIDALLLAEQAGGRVSTGPATDTKMKGRETCGCTVHTDIGDYVTQECGYACAYCYANPNHRRFGGDGAQSEGEWGASTA